MRFNITYRVETVEGRHTVSAYAPDGKRFLRQYFDTREEANTIYERLVSGRYKLV